MNKKHDINELLSLPLKEKAEIYIAYSDNIVMGDETDYSEDEIKFLLESFQNEKEAKEFNKILDINRKITGGFLPNFLAIGDRYIASVRNVERLLDVLQAKERTAIGLSKIYKISDRDRGDLDPIAASILIEPDLISLDIDEDEEVRYNLDPGEWIRKELAPAVKEYGSNLMSLKSTTEALYKWLRNKKATSSLPPSMKEYIDGIKECSISFMNGYYSFKGIEKAERKGEYVSPSRRYIAENYPLPSYKTSELDEASYKKVLNYLG